MTAAEHVAEFDAAGDAAVRAHLAFEHVVGCAVLGLDPLDVPLPFAIHVLLTDPRTHFPEEKPA